MKTKRQGALSSIWEMTLSERQNAALFLEHTTAKPFVYCRYFFKCFFCKEQFSDITALLKHNSTHEMPDRDRILKDLLPKGKRTVKVDISDLKCKICGQNYDGIDAIRNHLTLDHQKVFTASGNGIVAYNLSSKDGQFNCHICGKVFQTFILLNRHMNVHFSNAVCETCGAGFMTHQRLLQHKEIHLPGGYPCNQCDKVYTTSSNLKYHVEKAHEGATNMRMLRCAHCPERFTEHFRKLKHLKDVHGITFTFECEVCRSTFPSRRGLTMHTNKFHTEKTQCSTCKKSFSCVSTLKKHMVSHTGERQFVCRVCQKSYRHQKSLKQHARIHVHDCGGFHSTNQFDHLSKSSVWQMTVHERHNAVEFVQNTTIRPFVFAGSNFKCFYCYKHIPELKKLLQHTSAHNIPDRSFLLSSQISKGKRPINADISKLRCRNCDAPFACLNDVRQHLIDEHEVVFSPANNGIVEFDMTLTDGMFRCLNCDEMFAEFSPLYHHMSSTHLRKIVCEECGNGFMNRYQLINHQQIHKTEVKCRRCDQVFKKRNQLKYHWRVVHRGFARNSKQKCPKCSVIFKEHYEKVIHMRDEHGITKKFECHLCKTNFEMKRELTEHIVRDHEQKYRCDECFNCFVSESKLKSHKMGHLKKKSFMCSICLKSYIHKRSLIKHIKSHNLVMVKMN